MTINAKAKKYRLDPYFVAAVIQTESTGNIYCIRAEAKKLMTDSGSTLFLSLWKWYYEADNFADLLQPYCSRPTEWVGQMMAWGPMQVQGTVAREHGFKGWFPELCSWDLGIEYGCNHLRKKADKYGDNPDMLYACYNGGSPQFTKTGSFLNQKNVDNFMRNYRELVK